MTASLTKFSGPAVAGAFPVTAGDDQAATSNHDRAHVPTSLCGRWIPGAAWDPQTSAWGVRGRRRGCPAPQPCWDFPHRNGVPVSTVASWGVPQRMGKNPIGFPGPLPQPARAGQYPGQGPTEKIQDFTPQNSYFNWLGGTGHPGLCTFQKLPK